MELNDSDDLIKFINKEKKNISELDLTHAYKIFCRSLPKNITTIYKKIYSINIDAIDVIIAGCNIYNNVYWFILRYTNNCDVALFLSETSVNLFLTSIITSHETLQDNPFKITPNISDSIKFAYKKTIGPLQCVTDNNKDIDNSQMAGQIIKMFIIQIMQQIIISDILPNGIFKNKIPHDDTEITKILPRIEILLDFIQNQNKMIIQSIWHIIYFTVNKDSEEITDKLYYQIVHYIKNYAVDEKNKISDKQDNEIEWINQRQKQIYNIYNNVKSIVEHIKDFNDGS